MKPTGRFGHSCAFVVGMAATRARNAATRRNFIIGKWSPLSVWLIDYPIDPYSVRLAATPRSRSAHAVLHLSPRAHGLDPALAIRAFCRWRVRRADLDLYRGHVRHRRYRYGENLVADDLRHEQAAIRQARGAELHHGRGQQRRQARRLVRPSQHPALREHAADPRRPWLSARRRYADRAHGRPPAGLARLPVADQLRSAPRAQDVDGCVGDL